MSSTEEQSFHEDFLQEASEHLQAVRSRLLALEEMLDNASYSQETRIRQAEIMDELFRSFHTLKGLSGMVGLGQAARLAHAVESVLQAARSSKIELNGHSVDAILQSTHLLDQHALTLTHPGTQGPPVDALIAALSGLLPALEARAESPAAAAGEEKAKDLLSGFPQAAAGLTEHDWQKLEAVLAAGKQLSLGFFSPSREKNERGIHVEALKTRLSAAGELLKVAPVVAGSSVQFAFILASTGRIDAAAYPELEWAELTSSTAPDPAPPAARPVTLRVNLQRMDELMILLSDMAMNHTRLQEIIQPVLPAFPQLRSEYRQWNYRMERDIRRMRRAILSSRLVPLATVFAGMPLAVRDLAKMNKKQINLQTEGGEAEIDKALADRLLDPLLHLVRNAAVHGLETPTQRTAAGKPEAGTITLRGEPEGDFIRISVSDDGRGLNLESLQRKAAERGISTAAGAILPEPLVDLLCSPGFTTHHSTDLSAGRGVGLEVVYHMVLDSGGSLQVETHPGQGTTFTLRLPVTLMLMRVLFVRRGGLVWAVPLDSVEEIIELQPEKISLHDGSRLYPYGNTSLLLADLAPLFHSTVNPPSAGSYAIIIKSSDRRTALLADHLSGIREVVIHPLKDPLVTRPDILGATDLSDGGLALVIDAAQMIHRMEQEKQG